MARSPTGPEKETSKISAEMLPCSLFSWSPFFFLTKRNELLQQRKIFFFTFLSALSSAGGLAWLLCLPAKMDQNDVRNHSVGYGKSE